MTREEQLVFCKKCTNRKMDAQQGLICTLTGEKANFSNECVDFNIDHTVKERLDDVQPIEQTEVKNKLPLEVYEKLRMEQNYPMAVIAGLAAGIIGAILWGVITVITNYQIGYMAIAVGAGVGFAMRLAGKGVDQIFGITGGIIAVLGCVLGNFLSIIQLIAVAEGMDYFEILLMFDFAYFIPLMSETFDIMDLVFYGIAGFEGYKFAFRVFTEKNLASLE